MAVSVPGCWSYSAFRPMVFKAHHVSRHRIMGRIESMVSWRSDFMFACTVMKCPNKGAAANSGGLSRLQSMRLLPPSLSLVVRPL